MASGAQSTVEILLGGNSSDVAAANEEAGDDSAIDFGSPLTSQEASQAVTEVQQEVNGEVNEASPVLGDANDKQIQEHELSRPQNPASLYCAVSGNPHYPLTTSNVMVCPTCRQNLSPLDRPPPRPITPLRPIAPLFPISPLYSASEADSDSGLDSTMEGSEEIQHAVELKDAGGNTIKVKNWDSPFNLRDARRQGKKKLNRRGILRVVTVLNTSVPKSRHWDKYEVKVLEKEMPVLQNPKYSIGISSRKLVIASAPFVSILREICTYGSGRQLDGDLLQVEEPYSIIVHHLDELEIRRQRLGQETADTVMKTGSTHPDKEAYNHLSAVLNYINEVFQDRISHELTWHAKSPAMCTYRMLWLLFKPGSTVYVERDGMRNAFVVDSVNMGDAVLSVPSEMLGSCLIKLWNLHFDGRCVTRKRSSTTIHPFPAERSILSLKVVPSEYWDAHDNKELRTKLEDEGRKWYKLLDGSQVNYCGELASVGKRWLEGRVFIDSALYHQLESQESSSTEPKRRYRMSPNLSHTFDDEDDNDDDFNSSMEWSAYSNIEPKKTKSLELPADSINGTNHRYLLCEHYLKGFVFKSRTWETVDVAFCNSPKLNRMPFERLIMPEDQKLLIKALVYKYTDPRFAANNAQQVWAADFIKNKGEGQIILLHGGPGVGKTFTAECIAEFTGRPLLAITSGDLGTDEVSVERELNQWLKLAHKWGAVMLIDEADVFLEKRMMGGDMKRNSLVSVFLRELEYYQGILFLTTNRVGHFDDAFISRIHIVIYYEDLSQEYRRKIWNQFFDKLQEERGESITVDKSARRYVLEEPAVSSYKWNGREIRNAFQTAVALAEYRFLTKPEMEKSEGELATLTERDFEQVCSMSMKFRNYLMGVNQGDDEKQRAWRAQWRLGEEERQ